MFLHKKIQERKWEILILSLIIVIGIFLRTYHFHEWLHFGSDQVRDVIVAENVVSHTSAWPLLGADASNTHFKLGPMYNYFQIAAEKIFGQGDVAVAAYPDLLFSILTLPLFYFFLRKYFDQQLSLVLTLLYTVSFYTVEFSRFAWNQNPVPFFVMLYLYAFSEFFAAREKTAFVWIAVLGIAFGVAVQLHTLLLILIPTHFVIAGAYLLRKEWRVWSKVILIIGMAILLNASQIVSEVNTHGDNTKFFMNAFTDRSGSGLERFLDSFEEDTLAHAQANAHILSSLGHKWIVNFTTLLAYPNKSGSTAMYALAGIGIVVSVLFSVFGYGLLVRNFCYAQDNKKKEFFGLLLLYVALSFGILFSVARGAPLRYFIHTTFVPFVIFGCVVQWLRSRFPQSRGTVFITLLVVMLVGTNAYSLSIEASHLAKGTRGDSGWVVLGEAEQMVQYIIASSAPAREADLIGGIVYMSTYYKSLRYLAAQKNFQLNRGSTSENFKQDKPLFYIGAIFRPEKARKMSHYPVLTNQTFGQIGITQFFKE
jgi:4-amino-4-deoxy-L-arabinose transferase-like glycosyltransferase